MSDDLVVASEDDAWALFERAVKDQISVDLSEIRFDGWPNLSLQVEGPRWDQSVPTRVMPAILEYQAQVYRGYCKAKYGTWDTRRLTQEERNHLEIVVRVKKGSSWYETPLWKTLNRLIDAGIDKMEPNQIIMLAVSLGLVMVSPILLKTWLNARYKEKELDTRLEMSREETARQKIMADAMKKSPEVVVLEEAAGEARNKVVRSLSKKDQFHMDGVEIDGDDAEEISRRPRQVSEPSRLDGKFRILGVDSSDPNVFRLRLKEWKGELEFKADAREASLSHDQRQALQKGEWRRLPVVAAINIKKLRGEITAAEIVSVRLAEDSDE